MLHDHGLRIPYDWVLNILAQLVNAAVARYVEKGVICPPKLRKGFFSTSVMDNIDYGTSMLFMQPRNMVSVLIKVCDIAVCFCYPPRCRYGNAVGWIFLKSWVKMANPDVFPPTMSSVIFHNYCERCFFFFPWLEYIHDLVTTCLCFKKEYEGIFWLLPSLNKKGGKAKMNLHIEFVVEREIYHFTVVKYILVESKKSL